MEVHEPMPIEERLEAHDGRLNNQDERLNAHGARLTKLEEYDEEKNKRMKVIERNHKDLEKIIVSENREMRSFILANMDKQWDLIKSRDDHRHDSKKMKHEYDKSKMEQRTDVVLKLLGAGGIVYLVLQQTLGG